jgi:hypothetical protein
LGRGFGFAVLRAPLGGEIGLLRRGFDRLTPLYGSTNQE